MTGDDDRRSSAWLRGFRLSEGDGPGAWQVVVMLLAGWAVAFAMPFVDLIGRNGAFLVAHGLRDGRLVAYLAVLVIVVPLVLAVPVLLLRWQGLWYGALLSALLAAMSAIVLLTFGTQLTSAPGILLAALSILGGAVLGPLVVGSEAGRRGLVVLGLLAPSWVLVQFVAFSPAGALITGNTTSTTTATALDVPVFLLVLDELPLSSLLTADGEIDAELFPGFAELADSATWYPHARTWSTNTLHVVPSMLTGRQVDGEAELPVGSEYPDLLFGFLGDRDILSVEPITSLCEVDSCRTVDEDTTATGTSPWPVVSSDTAMVFLHQVLPPDLTASLPSVSDGWAGFAGAATADGQNGDAGDAAGADDDGYGDGLTREEHAQRVQDAVWGDSSVAAEAFINSIEDVTTSSFAFAHLMLPHSPWTHLPSGDRVITERRGEPAKVAGGGGVWVEDAWLTTHMYQRHLLQLQFTDTLVGRFQQAIRERGLWDEAVVVVASDHGVTFEPGLHRRSTETPAVAADLLPIPLFVKFPGQDAGVRSEVLASPIDIAPTIAEHLQITPRPDYEGQVLAAEGGVAPGADEDWQRLLHAASEKYELFDLDGPNGLYAFKPHIDVIGSSVEDFAMGEQAGLVVELRDRAGLEQVAAIDGVSPALVEGSMRGPALESGLPPVMAVVIDGVVAGVAKPFDRGGARFQTLVDPAYVTPGPHEVAIYLLDDRNGRLVLMPTELA